MGGSPLGDEEHPGMTETHDKRRILVVDDEASIVDFVTMGLRYEGFEIASASSGRDALDQFLAFRPDVVVLDWMLPDIDGLEVCRKMRGISDVAVIMLTARGDLDDKVAGLESGADDYIPKPFKFEELLARVRALLRRMGRASSTTLAHRDIEVDLARRQVRKNGQPIDLTLREYELLTLLMRRPGQVFTREQILEQLWGFDFQGDTNVVEVHVSALRAKLSDTDRQLIRTVRGVGYGLGG